MKRKRQAVDKKIHADSNSGKISLEKRYEMIVRARNFHYENFNKWMSYFYVMIGAVILGFSYIISKCDNYDIKYSQELIVLSLIGFVLSLFWHWANKGYYYWNINFITLVNHYEKNLLKWDESERIYFTFANKDVENSMFNPAGGANISTSRISILLSYLFALFFGAHASFRLFKENISPMYLLLICGLLISAASIGILGIFARRYLSGNIRHFPDLRIDSTQASSYRGTRNWTV